jgi:hypothetical protein
MLRHMQPIRLEFSSRVKGKSRKKESRMEKPACTGKRESFVGATKDKLEAIRRIFEHFPQASCPNYLSGCN